jgi:hypothetical protein
MSTSEKNKKIVWVRFKGQCAICHKELLHESEDENFSLLGEVAHIVGEQNNAPRGDHPMPLKERNDIKNLLLLCLEHHKIIDDHPELYPIEKLHEIKQESLVRINNFVPMTRKWDAKISHLSYINVPRLSELAFRYEYKVDLQHYKEGKSLDSLGWNLNYVMSAFENTLSKLSIDAIEFSDMRELHNDYIGGLVSFDRVRFRTKVFSEGTNKNIIDFPHIYYQNDLGWKLVLQIDKQFITTTTAHCNFSPSSGQFTFSGLFRIKDVDFENDIIIASPLVLGSPPSPFDLYFNSNKQDTLVNKELKEELDAFADLKEGEKRQEFAYFTEYVCDFCKKILDKEKYFIDGKTKQGPWGLMCTKCFEGNGIKIEWGYGQLYQNTKDGWLLVGGYDPEEDDYED